MSTDPLDDDLDRELSAAGARWRGTQGAAPMVDPDLFERTATRRRSRFTAGAIAAAVVLIVGGVMLAASTSRDTGTTAPVAPASPPPPTLSPDPTVASPPAVPEPVGPPMVCSYVIGTAAAPAAASASAVPSTTKSAAAPASAVPSTTNSVALQAPECGEVPDGSSGWCAGGSMAGATGAGQPGEQPTTEAGCSLSSGSCSVDEGSTVAACTTCDITLAPGAPPTSSTADASAPPTVASASPTAPVSATTGVPPCPGIAIACPAGATCTVMYAHDGDRGRRRHNGYRRPAATATGRNRDLPWRHRFRLGPGKPDAPVGACPGDRGGHGAP